MPLDGLGLGHESDSVHSDMLKSHVLGRPGGEMIAKHAKNGRNSNHFCRL